MGKVKRMLLGGVELAGHSLFEVRGWLKLVILSLSKDELRRVLLLPNCITTI
jgi:hypothetical protein